MKIAVMFLAILSPLVCLARTHTPQSDTDPNLILTEQICQNKAGTAEYRLAYTWYSDDVLRDYLKKNVYTLANDKDKAYFFEKTSNKPSPPRGYRPVILTRALPVQKEQTPTNVRIRTVEKARAK